MLSLVLPLVVFFIPSLATLAFELSLRNFTGRVTLECTFFSQNASSYVQLSSRGRLSRFIWCANTCRLGHKVQLCSGDPYNFGSGPVLTSRVCRLSEGLCDDSTCPNECSLHQRETNNCRPQREFLYRFATCRKCFVRDTIQGVTLCTRAAESLPARQMSECVHESDEEGERHSFFHGQRVVFEHGKLRWSCVCLNGTWFKKAALFEGSTKSLPKSICNMHGKLRRGTPKVVETPTSDCWKSRLAAVKSMNSKFLRRALA